MFDVKDSLLPPTATPLAKALDILEERLFALPVQMISKDPAAVDAGLLDHLAWEYSVDVWDADWPESQKRTAIAASEEVHRFKGTPYSIKVGLAAYDFDCELVEWFDVQDGVPGTFSVTAWVDGEDPWHGRRMDRRSQSVVHHVLRAAAPVSRGYTVRLGQKLDRPMSFAAPIGVRVVQMVDALFPRAAAEIWRGHAVHTRNIQTIGVT